MAKILVVEDDKFLTSAYRAKLTKAGFETDTASDGEEAIEKLKTSVPDIMLLDLVMPRKDGFAVLKEVRGQDNLKDLPIIVTSNLGQKEDMDKAKSLGATDYIIKSDMTMESLVDKVNSLL
ncbi:MAG: response regulator [Candidatus Saccharibacteria bacterium]|nr:response regulator [Candidatus Saccharibacteria bacterium]